MKTVSRDLGICLAFILCLSGTRRLMGQDVDSVQYVRRTERLTDIAFLPAKQRCENWAVASAVQSALEMEGVPLPQSALVLKMSGTDTCGPNLKSPAELADLIKGEYKLASGASVHVHAQLYDTHVDPGRLITSIRDNRPFLWSWNNHVYMVVGMVYVDAVHSSGLHEYDIQQMELMDPFAGAEQKPTIFQKTQATLAQVRGIIEIIASH
jgi:hypothetical protein